MSYKPGLHILAEFNSTESLKLYSSTECQAFFDQLIGKYGLQKVGEVYHDFENGGFTAVVCLTESHLSIHTWPEYGLATFDIFLSNYQQENDEKVRSIYNEVIKFFNGVVDQKNEVKR